MCWTAQMDGIWCTTPGLHLHKEGWGATCCCACWSGCESVCVEQSRARGSRTGVFEKQGRAGLWQVAAAGWWRGGAGDGDAFGSKKVKTILKRTCSLHRGIMDACPWSFLLLSGPGGWHYRCAVIALTPLYCTSDSKSFTFTFFHLLITLSWKVASVSFYSAVLVTKI